MTHAFAETSAIAPADDLALVLDGGGARAAYQLGVLRGLARHHPDLHFPIITGVSAGAINAAFLAAYAGSQADATMALGTLWSELTVDKVFRVDPISLLDHVVRWGVRLVSGGGPLAPRVRGLVDTTPLRRTLEVTLGSANGDIVGVASNLEAGRLRALALITSNYSTGQSAVWVQGSAILDWERPERRSRQTRMRIDHVMASAALPLIFPAVQLPSGWHGDGGIRLTAPCSPALHLGARRILAISTRHDRTAEEADRPMHFGYPAPLQIAGQLFNAMFLDDMSREVRVIERLNTLIAMLPPGQPQPSHPIDLVVIRPSQDLGQVAASFEPQQPWLFRHLTRSLGSRETMSPDLLSLLMFQPDYIRRLMAIGESDAQSHAATFGRLLRAPTARSAPVRSTG